MNKSKTAATGLTAGNVNHKNQQGETHAHTRTTAIDMKENIYTDNKNTQHEHTRGANDVTNSTGVSKVA